jgi:hypothetical protein
MTRFDEKRFWSRIDKNGSIPDHCPQLGHCWVWTGALNRAQSGYGRWMWNHRLRLATHIVLEIYEGVDVPSGLHVLHRCDNTLCVNPEHVFLGTQAENVWDMHKKNRAVACQQSRLTVDDVRVIRQLKKDGWAHKEIARRYGLSATSVTEIVNYRNWAHVDPEHGERRFIKLQPGHRFSQGHHNNLREQS